MDPKMKRILITGAGSYIGTSFDRYIKDNFSNDYILDTVDMTDASWREESFAGYDSVFHVAGIAHRKETLKNAGLYYEINRDLAIETEKKAKTDGVRQFIFLSSMSVYGMDTGVITKETPPDPKSHYGRSKYMAEQTLSSLADGSFAVCILRPPMVYGSGCKGNFQKLVKIVKAIPFFPSVKNERSMLYIDNLSNFVRLCMDRNLSGVYFPQNRAYVSTSVMAEQIARTLNMKRFCDPLTGWIAERVCPFLPVAGKAFGSLVYRDTEDFSFSYVIVENDESFRRSVL
jgi:UDP-glucose 4-epimerase